jgi:hypothetical protein
MKIPCSFKPIPCSAENFPCSHWAAIAQKLPPHRGRNGRVPANRLKQVPRIGIFALYSYLARHIPGARLAELPGDDHLWWVGDSDAITNEIEEFLTGERHAPEADRVLVTALFTDIVESTRRAAELGDRRWRDLLDSHNG